MTQADLMEDWQYEVANGDTRLGFTDWCENQVDADEEEREVPYDTPSLDTSFHDHEMDV